MGDLKIEEFSDPERLRVFMKCLLNDVRALEKMIAEGLLENDIRRIGAEQELFLIDRAWRPAPRSMETLEHLNQDIFKTELAQFNLEFNHPPLRFSGDCLRQLEAGFNELLEQARRAAERTDCEILLTGILPTLQHSDLRIENMTPMPRYFALNNALKRLRGSSFEFSISGADELQIKHDSVMLEACNTSVQFHFQVGPEEFVRLYNIAQAILGPVVAAAVNSPLLFGRRLWQETRIAVFQQAVDTRQPQHHPLERTSRVSFGGSWVKESAVEIFRDDITRFRVVLGLDIDEDPFEVLADGGVPKLKALQLHNSTVYRWNRPCYGISDGKPHLRIENRAIASGPTVLDEVANASFWFGLMSGMAHEYDDITQLMSFDQAKTNFLGSARFGLDAQLSWIDREKIPAHQLILDRLLPLAHQGLRASGIDDNDIERYLGVIEKRVSSRRTGSQWMIDSLEAMGDAANPAERFNALTAAIASRQKDGNPVHEWPLAQLHESGDWKHGYQRVEQYMTTDVFTVHENEVIDLVANVMDWRKVRHIPVEDDDGRLIGLISYRSLIRFLAQDLPHGKDHPVPAGDIMQRDPITIGPETTTLDAINVMRRERVACLPVVKDGRLVGIVTEQDFVNIAAELFEAHLRT
jgi:CBS domain-containing protein